MELLHLAPCISQEALSHHASHFALAVPISGIYYAHSAEQVPEAGSVVKVHYTGWLESTGKQFDSSKYVAGCSQSL